MATYIRRRELISTLCGAAAWPLVARAQQRQMPVIGVLYSVSAAQWTEQMAGFHQGLRESGYVAGRNVAIEYRWADNQIDRLPAMIADLVGRKVGVILVGGNVSGVRATIAATQSIPIVFTTATDPVATGLLRSLNHPGSNVTGATFMGDQLGPKHLELLHEVLPAVTRFAVLVNPENPVTSRDAIQAAEAAAPRLGLEFIIVRAAADSETETAFTTAVREHAAAITMNDAFFANRREQIGALGLRHMLPVIAGEQMALTTGVLMSYGAKIPDTYRQAGIYVGRILKGEKPGELPVLQPTKFELIVNLKTAKALGLKIAETFLVRADEVVE